MSNNLLDFFHLGVPWMVVPSRRKVPFFSWLIPILLILCIGVIGIYDYLQQHVKVQMFGTVIDSADVNSVIIQPAANKDPKHPFYTVTGHGDIVGLLQHLGHAKQTTADHLLPADAPLDSLYIGLSNSETLQVRLYQSSAQPDTVWIEFQHKVYAATHELTDFLRQLEQKLR
jgi:hypothetical protein